MTTGNAHSGIVPLNEIVPNQLINISHRKGEHRLVMRSRPGFPRVERIQAMLASTNGDLYLVWLDATVSEISGTFGIAEAEISNLALSAGNCKLPDGGYTLEYFFCESVRQPVWIKSGTLVTQ